MEVGTRHDGLCDPFSMKIAEARHSLGDSGSAHEVGTFSSRANDLHIGGILPIVHSRDRLTTWSVIIHSVE